jgi:hypothetical protein
MVSKELGNIVYKNLKQEITSSHYNLETSSNVSQALEAADLLLYRGEKYKENRLKLKEEISLKEIEKCTFKPTMLAKSISRNPKKRQGIREIKHKMNGALEKYINPNNSSSANTSHFRETVSQTQSIRVSQENAQQSSGYGLDLERIQVEEMKDGRVDTEESEPKSLTRYLQSKAYSTTGGSISNSGEMLSPIPTDNNQGN